MDKPDLHESLGERTSLESIGGVKIMTLSPSPQDKNEYDKILSEFFKKDNEKSPDINDIKECANGLSIVFALVYNDIKILLTGDALAPNWEKIINLWGPNHEWLPANIMKASHHGSKNSFYVGMWDSLLVDGSILCISSGKSAHPSEELISEFRGTNHKILCTNKGNYCRHKTFISSDPRESFHFENTSEEDDRTCCDWIEIKVSPDSPQKIEYTTGRKDPHRHCMN